MAEPENQKAAQQALDKIVRLARVTSAAKKVGKGGGGLADKVLDPFGFGHDVGISTSKGGSPKSGSPKGGNVGRSGLPGKPGRGGPVRVGGSKARYVRSAGGAKRYGQPIGSLITKDSLKRAAEAVGGTGAPGGGRKGPGASPTGVRPPAGPGPPPAPRSAPAGRQGFTPIGGRTKPGSLPQSKAPAAPRSSAAPSVQPLPLVGPTLTQGLAHKDGSKVAEPKASRFSLQAESTVSSSLTIDDIIGKESEKYKAKADKAKADKAKADKAKADKAKADKAKADKAKADKAKADKAKADQAVQSKEPVTPDILEQISGGKPSNSKASEAAPRFSMKKASLTLDGKTPPVSRVHSKSDLDVFVNGVKVRDVEGNVFVKRRGKWYADNKNDKAEISLDELDKIVRNGTLSRMMTDKEYSGAKNYIVSSIDHVRSLGMSTTKTETNPDGSWKAERFALHTKIADEMYAKAANVPNDRKALISGGLGGSGKGTTLGEYAGIPKDKYFTINSDDVKEVMYHHGMIPQVDGLSPAESVDLIHEESGFIADMLQARALADGKNIILDTTLGKERSAKEKVESLKAQGYSVSGIMVDISVDESIKRAESRHRRGMEDRRAGSGWGGRWVPPDYIASHRPTGDEFKSSNREIFEKFKKDFDTWQVWNNEGAAPRLEDESKQNFADHLSYLNEIDKNLAAVR